MQQRVKICSLCNGEIRGYGATSRRDNKTKICSRCAIIEAWHDYALWEQAKVQRRSN